MHLSLFRIADIGQRTPAELLQMLSKRLYNSETGIGFRDLEIEESFFVSGVAVKRRPIFVRVFDENLGQTVEREEFLMSEIFFRLDVNARLAEVYGGPRDSRYVTEVFSETLGDGLRLEVVNETVYEVLSSLREGAERYEIHRLDINEFSSEKGVVGNYSIKSIEPQKAWKLVDQYRSQVRSATLTRTDIAFQASVQILGSGRFRLAVRPRSSDQLVVDSLKTSVRRRN